MDDVAIQHDQAVAVSPASPYPPSIPTHEVHVQLHERRRAMDAALAGFCEDPEPLAALASALVETLRAGGKVLVAGNGGSAAEAQHFAGELVGRFLAERQAYSAIALCVDSAVVTAIANDYGYENVFARQIEGLGRPGDLFIAISTSGASDNLLRAADMALRQGLVVAAITGNRPNPLEQRADYAVRVPATSTPLIQELQMIVTHVLCGIAEAALVADQSGVQR